MAKARRTSIATKVSGFTALLVVWIVAVVVAFDSTHPVFDPFKVVFLLVLLAISAGLISRITIHLLIKPLALLEEGIEELKAGRLRQIRVSRTGDEFEFLGESFNEMVVALAASQSQVNEYHDRLENRIRERTEALEHALQRALSANHAKSEFLANMSHELRTPMTGIIGMLDVVLDGPLPEEEEEYLRTARTSAHALLGLLNDLLDLSKIEAGRMVMQQIPFEIGPAVTNCLRPHLSVANAKGIRLTWRVAEDVTGSVLGDPQRFRQILSNLVSNAVKFTTAGEVVVELSRAGAPDGGARAGPLVLTVRDTGHGIPADKLGVIFEKFTQADGSISRRFGGTGLGLAITKKLVEMQNGAISVESTEGAGSLFTVTLPLPAVEPANETATAQPSPTGAGVQIPALPILVVEDNVINQKVITALLGKRGFKIGVAGDGQQALELLDRQPWAMVLMDVQMPVLDGLETTRRIRANARLQNLPVIAMTAHAMQGDRQRCLDAGMDDYLAKPIDQAELLRIVGEYCSRERPESRPASVARQKESSPPPDADSELVDQMMQLFLQLAPDRLDRLRLAAARGDLDELKRNARRLGSAAHSIEAISVAECADRLSSAAEKSDWLQTRKSLLQLEKSVALLERSACPPSRSG